MNQVITHQSTDAIVGESVFLVAQESEFTTLGGMPFLKYLWPNSEILNAMLCQLVLEKMKNTPSLKAPNVTNIGGWHSERNLSTWGDPAVYTLLERIRAIVREMVRRTVVHADHRHFENWKIEAWANVNRYGAFNRTHSHAGGSNLWSGIYYIDPGEPEAGGSMSGLTRFEDRSGVPKEVLLCVDPFERELTVVPQSGLMVLFPATLLHYVTPYFGHGDRITIAFNLTHSGFVLPKYQEPDDRTMKSFFWRNFRGPMLVASWLRRMLRRRGDARQ